MSTATQTQAQSQAAPPIVNLPDLWRFKWRIVLTAVVFVICGAAYLAVTPPTYEVSSRVMVREDNPLLLQPQQEVLDREFLATQAEVIRSPLIILEALKDVPVALPDGYEKGEVAFVLESLTVSPIVQTDVLKIVYRGDDPEVAKKFTSALVERYEQYMQQADQGRHAEDLELLTQREAEIRQQLEQLQDEHTQFRRESPLLGQSRETLIVLSNQLALLGERLSEARNRRIALENKLDTYALAKADSQGDDFLNAVVPALLQVDERAAPLVQQATLAAPADNDPSTNVLRDVSNAGGADFTEIQLQLWQARGNVEELSTKYGAQHPELVSAADRVQYWEKLLKQRVFAAEFGLAQELEAAKTTESNLQKLYDEERTRVKELDDFLVEETAMSAKIARTSEIHAAALTVLKDYELTEESLEKGRSSAIVRVLDGPELQEEIVWPQPKLILAMSGALGLMAGVVLVSLRRQ